MSEGGTDGWDRAKVIISAIATIIVPLSVVSVGNTYSEAMKERELEGRFVEIALDILRAEPEEGSMALRKWATKVVDRYSGVTLSAGARDDLILKRAFPRRPLTWEDFEDPSKKPSLGDIRRGLGIRP